MSTLKMPQREAPAQGTIFRIPDPMCGLMGSRYGTRPAGPIQRQSIPPPPEPSAPPKADPAPPPDAEKAPRDPHAGPNLDTVRGRVLLVVGLMTHRRRTAGGRRDVEPRRPSDLPSLSREDLAVECWRIYGAPFAMQRHDYPNVIATTSKLTELIASGLLMCQAQGEVSLSKRGWWWWRRVMRENGGVRVPEDSGLFDRIVSSGDAPNGR